ncbi:MAG: glycoside hydrolase family 108 protein [Rhodothalassiaceae bacterium]
MHPDALIEALIRREGGFVDDADDPGGATKYGITLAVLEAWRGRRLGREDVAALDSEEARAIYGELYYRRPGLDRLPAVLQPPVLDAAVNQGPVTAIRMLQQVLDAVGPEALLADGILGERTAAAADRETRRLGPWLVAALVDERRRRYCRLAARRPASAKFLDGWLRRATEFAPSAQDLEAFTCQSPS